MTSILGSFGCTIFDVGDKNPFSDLGTNQLTIRKNN